MICSELIGDFQFNVPTLDGRPIYLFVCIANHISICAKTNYIIQSDWPNHSYIVYTGQTCTHRIACITLSDGLAGLVSWEFGPWVELTCVRDGQ